MRSTLAYTVPGTITHTLCERETCAVLKPGERHTRRERLRWRQVRAGETRGAVSGAGRTAGVTARGVTGGAETETKIETEEAAAVTAAGGGGGGGGGGRREDYRRDGRRDGPRNHGRRVSAEMTVGRRGDRHKQRHRQGRDRSRQGCHASRASRRLMRIMRVGGAAGARTPRLAPPWRSRPPQDRHSAAGTSIAVRMSVIGAPQRGRVGVGRSAASWFAPTTQYDRAGQR